MGPTLRTGNGREALQELPDLPFHAVEFRHLELDEGPKFLTALLRLTRETTVLQVGQAALGSPLGGPGSG